MCRNEVKRTKSKSSGLRANSKVESQARVIFSRRSLSFVATVPAFRAVYGQFTSSCNTPDSVTLAATATALNSTAIRRRYEKEGERNPSRRVLAASLPPSTKGSPYPEGIKSDCETFFFPQLSPSALPPPIHPPLPTIPRWPPTMQKEQQRPRW